MRALPLAAALIGLTFSAHAAALPGLHAGMVLVDTQHHRLGDIDQVNADGSVGVVMDGAYAVVPGDTLRLEDGHPVTKLTRQQVESLASSGN